ncbi:MAG: inorganic diphosphatase [Patescibacteria group bacterium]|nr:inorganic diphosphatase [Patescibacteria group bacterium]MCL5257950.1 inorganic diphosphatase [Patescibacteria group bacterium]
MNILKISSGKKPPEEVNALIEIVKGSNVKYELDKDSGVLVVDRFLHTAMGYPFNYGFIPGTLAEDGDPIDILVLADLEFMPGTLIGVKPIGMLAMEDEAGIDTKIISVPVIKIDPVFGQVEDINDLAEPIKNKIKHFFENYKTLEPGKWVKVKNWLGRAEAIRAVSEALKRANETAEK